MKTLKISLLVILAIVLFMGVSQSKEGLSIALPNQEINDLKEKIIATHGIKVRTQTPQEG